MSLLLQQEEKEKNVSSKNIHLVLSPKICPDIVPISLYLAKNSQEYIVTIERGENGHEHLDCFVTFLKEKRFDTFKKSILKLYPDIPKEEQKQVKLCKNTIDPNPLYGFGYSQKEYYPEVPDAVNNNRIYTNLSYGKLNKAYIYYLENQKKVNEAKAEIVKSRPNKQQSPTINGLHDLFVCWIKNHPISEVILKDQEEHLPPNRLVNAYEDIHALRPSEFQKLFHEFYLACPVDICFTDYQKINQQKFVMFGIQRFLKKEKRCVFLTAT